MARLRLFSLLLATVITSCGAPSDPDPRTTSAPFTANAPFPCPSGGPPAVFVSEVAPASVVAQGVAFDGSVTFANCSGATWAATPPNAPSGTKLGFAAPRDAAPWGVGRVALPADVVPGSQVTIRLSLRTPRTPGSATYQWAVVHEGVAWLSAASPLHTITVQGAAGGVAICEGVRADNSGGSPAAAQIQQCIDGTPTGGTLELPPGTYRVTSEIDVTKPITIRTAGTANDPLGCLDAGGPSCAVLRADAQLAVSHGFLRLEGTSDVTLSHVVIDGNRGARLESGAAAACANGVNRGPGFNAASAGCTHCAFVASASINALCGSGFEWYGDDASITGSTFRDNGDHNAQNMWSDGLTLLHSNGAHVENCVFIDNSDVDFVCGGAQNGTFAHNSISQAQQDSFAGMMMDNFNGSTPGDFTGLVASGNTIDCGESRCDIGFEIGPHPWYLSGNIRGGTVTGNHVTGGKFGINVEGGGTPSDPVVVTANVVGPTASSSVFNCGSRATTSYNVSPDSFVNLEGGPAPTGSFTFHGCQ